VTNPLKDWRLDPADITLTGKDLRRPECVLAEATGDLWVADLRGGVVHIAPDNTETVIRPRAGGGPFAPDHGANIDGNQGFSMPNGLCFDADGNVIIANFGTNVIEKLSRTGDRQLLFSEIDGRPLGKANFPAIDARGRLWFSVTASAQAWRSRTPGRVPDDGYIVLVDESGPRIVADQLSGANEIRFDENGEWLYVAETSGDHMTRLRFSPDGELIAREVYGPERLGGGPDGFAFDAYGNLWTTLIAANRLVAITPSGEILTIWEDGDPNEKAAHASRGLLDVPAGLMAPRMASITFGGPDLQTVYVGSLLGTSLPTFRSPVPGRPLSHWRRQATSAGSPGMRS
jgi:gluconolactonase